MYILLARFLNLVRFLEHVVLVHGLFLFLCFFVCFFVYLYPSLLSQCFYGDFASLSSFFIQIRRYFSKSRGLKDSKIHHYSSNLLRIIWIYEPPTTRRLPPATDLCIRSTNRLWDLQPTITTSTTQRNHDPW